MKNIFISAKTFENGLKIQSNQMYRLEGYLNKK